MVARTRAVRPASPWRVPKTAPRRTQFRRSSGLASLEGKMFSIIAELRVFYVMLFGIMVRGR
jgi:hypothetical protein